MVGGAPLTSGFAEMIGADAYTPDATTAAEVALEFCTK
jgi:methanogenic corrinoid protein MtbC1